jgi:hypothetical protein
MQEVDRSEQLKHFDLTTQIKVYQLNQTDRNKWGVVSQTAPSEFLAFRLKSSLPTSSSETQQNSVEFRVTISERFSCAEGTRTCSY